MSDLDRTSVSLLMVVALVAVLVKTASCNGGSAGSPPPAATQAVVGTVIVTGDSVNLRQDPTRSASVMARAERGTELELLGTQEDWYNVRWGEGTAWLSKRYASPTEDCPAEQPAISELLLQQMPGEWKGQVGDSPATFVFYTRNERLCAYVLYSSVKEVLALAASGPDTLTLTGQRYERLEGTTNSFGLDTFSGQLESSSGRLSGTYADANNNRGEWFAQRPGSSSEASLTSTDDGEGQLTTYLSEPIVDPSEPSAPTPALDSPERVDLQTEPDPVSSPPAEESASSVSEGDASSAESLFVGRWEGEGRQSSPRQRWRLQINITSESLGSTVGSIRYPSLRCGGELTLIKVQESTWTLREDITYGTNCISGGSITMASTGPGRAQWLWYYPQGELGAQGEVRRQGD